MCTHILRVYIRLKKCINEKSLSEMASQTLWNSYLPSPAPVPRCEGLLLLSPLLHQVCRVLTQIMHHI